jgi:hypothetical protein
MVIAHLADSALAPAARVRVEARLDKSGTGVLIATGESGVTGRLAAEIPGNGTPAT